MSTIDGRRQIAHLLRRAGFGASEAELDEYAALGFERSVDRLLNPEQVQDDLDARIAALNLDMGKPAVIQLLWLYRMINTKRPLQEKIALFWHGHFATAIQKVKSPQLMWTQYELLRDRGLGKFGDLVLAVSQDPAMLIWLDGRENKKAAPNENYARELMELFTLGIGHYTEDDVRAAARAFTGWAFRAQRAADGKHIVGAEFAFNPRQHDSAAKTFLGQTGNWNGDDVIRILMDQAACATFITRKLFSFFVWDDPDDKTVAPFADAFAKNGHDLRATLRAIFLSPEFSSDRAYHAKIKSPAEQVVGLLKSLGVTTPPRETALVMRQMGQELFNPPNVGGWTSGLGWVSTGGLLAAFNFANDVVTARGGTGASGAQGLSGQAGDHPLDPAGNGGKSGKKGAAGKGGNGVTAFDPARLLPDKSVTTAEALVDRFSGLFLDGDLSNDQRAALLAYLQRDADGKPTTFTLDAQTLDSKVRGLIRLTMTAPAFQLN